MNSHLNCWKKFAVGFLASLLLIGTAFGQKIEKPVVTYQGLAPRNIQHEIAPYFLFSNQEDLSGLTFFDQRYVAVTKDVMEKWVAAAAKKVDRTYVSELHDCDDLAWELLVFVRREAMKSHPRMEFSLCAGLAAIHITTPIPELGITFTGDHAVVLIRDREGIWWIIEPGTGKGTKLAEEIFDGRIQLGGVWF